MDNEQFPELGLRTGCSDHPESRGRFNLIDWASRWRRRFSERFTRYPASRNSAPTSPRGSTFSESSTGLEPKFTSAVCSTSQFVGQRVWSLSVVDFICRFHHANRWQILAALAWCLDLKENIWRHLGQFKKNFENLITIEYNRENLSIRPVVAPYIVLGQLLSVDTVEEHQNELARILLQLHCRVMAYLFRAHSLLSSWVTMMLDLGTDVALQDFITGEKAGVILESIPMPFLEAGPVVRGFGCAFSSEFEDAVVCDLSERSSNDLLSICETAVKTYINSKRSTEGNHEALVTSLSMVLNLHRWDIDSVEWQKKLSQRMNMGM